MIKKLTDENINLTLTIVVFERKEITFMKKYEQIVQFIVNIILGNIFKFILAFAILSILLYFTLFLGPLLGSAIGIFFILIFGEGSYLALIMWLSSICMFLCYTYLTITLVWSDEIKLYKEKRKRQQEQDLQNMFKDILIEMKQTAKAKNLEHDEKVQKCISSIEEFTVDTTRKEQYLKQLRSNLAKFKQEANLEDKAVQDSIKNMEKRIKDIENGTELIN